MARKKTPGRRSSAATARPATSSDSDPTHGRQGSEGDGASKLDPGLYVIATPIGNLADLGFRALEVLRGADLIACEDTRVTATLLRRYRIATPMTPYHDHNGARARPELLARLAGGARVALVSDAGTPLISDPGYKLVRAAWEAGHRVIAVPGPSAPMAALAVAGLPTDRFLFAGFLPARAGARRDAIADLAAAKATLVLFESPARLAATLDALAEGLGAREAAVTRELTKRHEEVRRGTLDELAAHYAHAGPPKGEIVVVVGPPMPKVVEEAEIVAVLEEALLTMSTREAVAHVARALGVPRRRVYALALARERGP